MSYQSQPKYKEQPTKNKEEQEIEYFMKHGDPNAEIRGKYDHGANRKQFQKKTVTPAQFDALIQKAKRTPARYPHVLKDFETLVKPPSRK